MWRAGFLTGFAALLALPVPAPAADGLGRLFTSQEQRRQLDAHRNGRAETPAAKPAPRPRRPAPTVKEAPIAAPLHLQGVVYRADGHNTAWIKGGNRRVAGVRRPHPAIKQGRIGPDSITLTPPGSAVIILKVGERLGPAGPVEQAPTGPAKQAPAGPAEQAPAGPPAEAPP